MCKLLQEWIPSQAAKDLIELNGIDNKQMEKSLAYLKSTDLVSIDDVDGYDNWNAFFIMFSVKAAKADK